MGGEGSQTVARCMRIPPKAPHGGQWPPMIPPKAPFSSLTFSQIGKTLLSVTGLKDALMEAKAVFKVIAYRDMVTCNEVMHGMQSDNT